MTTPKAKPSGQRKRPDDYRLSRKDFLARCATIYDAHLARPEVLSILSRWTDMMMRLQGGQLEDFARLLMEEHERTGHFYTKLANDKDGYDVIQLAAILTHHCQKCAEDTQAWWTRPAFCDHKDGMFGKSPKARATDAKVA